MRNFLLPIACIVALSSYCGIPDARTRNHHARNAVPDSDLKSTSLSEATYVPVIVELPDDDTTPLLDLGAIIYYYRNHLYLTSIPADKIDDIPRQGGIDKYSVAMTHTPSLDVARDVSGVNKVHTGTSLATSYTGEGVVTGICDIGFDPRHVNFTDKVVRWVIYDERNGLRTEYNGYDNIVANAPATDDVTKTHASHVANILAGGKATDPYHGVATGSEMVVTTSNLTDVGILAGIEDVIAYARANNRRAVVNISSGSYLGPHDGTDLVGRYLSALADEAVICFSAGNFGQRMNSFRVDLDDHPGGVGSLFFNVSGWDGLDVRGMTDLWSDNDRPFETRVVIWDVDSRKFAWEGPWMGGTTETGHTEYTLHEIVEPSALSGKVWMAWNIDPVNGRYNVAFDYEYYASQLQQAGPWARYMVGFYVRPVESDTHVWAYADGIASFLRNNGVPNMINGGANGSVSNLASCPDVFAIGAWNSRSEVPDVDSGTRAWNVVVGNVAPWSAYGTSGDGRPLPHFCAPGNPVVSALSNPHYYYDGPKDDADNTAYAVGDDRWFAASGTSMSSPFAAGVFALWLEADPNLTIDNLRDIAVSTADRNHADIADPRWGAGALDAYAGMAEVERRAGIGAVGDVTVGTDNKSDEPVYYNLQGIPVSKPVAGMTYIERRGDVSRVVMLRATRTPR